MEKRGTYSRGLAFVVLLAFILVLGAIAIISNPSSSGFVSKDIEKGIISEKNYCSGTCQVGYLISGTDKVKRVACAFNSKETPDCFCDNLNVPKGAQIVGNAACTVQYSN